MDKALHVLDPDGDVVLILPNKNTVLEFWDQPLSSLPLLTTNREFLDEPVEELPAAYDYSEHEPSLPPEPAIEPVEPDDHRNQAPTPVELWEQSISSSKSESSGIQDKTSI
ncbi:hypothetical protein LOZ58_005462 [Ophidiomyces ophidiicola]|nr:hypothetical protein LOZ58_005462 [Ophidiomyces ophidiicola]